MQYQKHHFIKDVTDEPDREPVISDPNSWQEEAMPMSERRFTASERGVPKKSWLKKLFFLFLWPVVVIGIASTVFTVFVITHQAPEEVGLMKGAALLNKSVSRGSHSQIPTYTDMVYVEALPILNQNDTLKIDPAVPTASSQKEYQKEQNIGQKTAMQAPIVIDQVIVIPPPRKRDILKEEVASAVNPQPLLAQALPKTVPSSPPLPSNLQRGAYTLQLLASGSEENIKRLIQSQDLSSRARLQKVMRNGQALYILLYGQYASYHDAKAAIATLPLALQRLNPWPRVT